MTIGRAGVISVHLPAIVTASINYSGVQGGGGFNVASAGGGVAARDVQGRGPLSGGFWLFTLGTELELSSSPKPHPPHTDCV